MIKWLFKVAPKIGSSWLHRDASPWASGYSVEVVDTKFGWVRYTAGEADMNFKYDRKIRDFRSFYREI